MKNTLKTLYGKYFNENLDFRAQIFNSLGLLGFALGLGFGTYSIFNYTGIVSILANYSTSLLAAVIIVAANRTGKFKFFFLLTVILVFTVIFPVLFFEGGGYRSSMPCFFVFAVVFTAIMLEGQMRAFCITLEFLIYAGCFLTAYYYPETIRHFPTETAWMFDIIVGCLASSAVLFIAICRHINIYDKKQKQLEKATAALEGLNRMKTEFLANTSHEMKTPLAVASAHIQRAERLFELAREGDAEKIRESFTLAHDEIMHLSHLAGDALRLASIQESGGGSDAVNLPDILNACANVHAALLDKNGNALVTEIPYALPLAAGSADAVSQVVSNLFSNANTHTQNGVIRLNAKADSNMLTVSMEDNGAGIPKDMIADVFERGVTDGSGSGLGLDICRQVVKSYGGEIHIESKPGKGTKVFFTLPVLRKGQTDG